MNTFSKNSSKLTIEHILKLTRLSICDYRYFRSLCGFNKTHKTLMNIDSIIYIRVNIVGLALFDDANHQIPISRVQIFKSRVKQLAL